MEPDINTEQKILEAAEILFLEKGFAMTSTVEIARVAGCNQALVHYYFRSKEKLFEKVFEKKATMFLSNFLQIGEQNIPFKEKLQRKIESHFDMVAANPRLPFLFLSEIFTNPGRLTKILKNMGDLHLSMFGQLQSELEIEIAKGNIRHILAIDLMVNIFSLNVMLFIVKPILQTVSNISDVDFQILLAHRKQENVKTILNSLQP